MPHFSLLLAPLTALDPVRVPNRKRLDFLRRARLVYSPQSAPPNFHHSRPAVELAPHTLQLAVHTRSSSAEARIARRAPPLFTSRRSDAQSLSLRIHRSVLTLAGREHLSWEAHEEEERSRALACLVSRGFFSLHDYAECGFPCLM
ncbi:hypothetical protein B0H19DRAFT_1369075 [Mycena capillaripes]|nr:hypothetical protein B0H19DRAFT_1369075 [Mycena capillaripes]